MGAYPRPLGQRALGTYTLAWNLVRRHLLRVTEAFALVTIAMAWGLALVAHMFMTLVFGERWQAITGPLQILAILASVRPIVTLVPQIMIVTGLSRFSMYKGTMGVIPLLAGFWLGSRWGTIGIAAAWLLSYLFWVLPLYWLVFQRIELAVPQHPRVLGGPVSASLAMAAALWALRWFLPEQVPLLQRFCLELSVGAATFCLIMLIFHRQRLQALRQFLNSMRAASPSH